MKRVCLVLCVCLLLIGSVVAFPAAAAAADNADGGDVLDIAVLYPKVTGLVTESFTFEVGLKNLTDSARDCELTTTAPPMWSVTISPQEDTTKKISALRLAPTGEAQYVDFINVVATPPAGAAIDPGDYTIKFTATAGEASVSTDLVAVISGSYEVRVVPVNGLFNTTATAGKSSVFSVDVQNWGTAPVTAIDFFSDKTEGWLVGVSISSIDSLRAGTDRVVDLTIIPPAKSIPGDYYFTFWAKGTEAAGKIDIRVTVETATVWGWIGLVIIVLIVAGLAYLYVAFRRR